MLVVRLEFGKSGGQTYLKLNICGSAGVEVDCWPVESSGYIGTDTPGIFIHLVRNASLMKYLLKNIGLKRFCTTLGR